MNKRKSVVCELHGRGDSRAAVVSKTFCENGNIVYFALPNMVAINCM